jgi:hypothetical protein
LYSGISIIIKFCELSPRKHNPELRLNLIKTGIYQNPDVGLVIIDGGRDLLSVGINDEKSATVVTTEFLRWTEEREIHIIVVLHQNKNDLNARGHFGTECVNKAETTASVTECFHERSISIVHCEYCRGVPFEDFAFRINEQGIPESCEIPRVASNRLTSTDPNDIEESVHRFFLSQVFSEGAPLVYSNLWRKIKSEFGVQGIKFGQSRAKIYVNYYNV